MALARVDGATGNAGANEDNGFSATVIITTTRTIDVGEKLFVDMGGGNAFGPVLTIVDGGVGNTFVLALEKDAGSTNAHTETWYCDVTIQIPMGTNIVVTWTTAGGGPKNAQVVGYTGLKLGGPEKTASGTGFGSSQASGTTAATTTADSLVRVVYVEQTSGTGVSSVATGYTVGSANGTSGMSTHEAYKTVGATGTQAATATASTADTWVDTITTWAQASSVPVNVTPAVISGQASVGKTLTRVAGSWTGADSVSGNWRRDGINIGGATSSTYVLVVADIGADIDYLETATHSGDPSATQASNSLGPVGVSIGDVAIRMEVLTDIVIELPAPNLLTLLGDSSGYQAVHSYGG